MSNWDDILEDGDIPYSEDEERLQDVAGVCAYLVEAWRILPEKPLAEFFDIALPSSVREMEDFEIIESLQEFIHQNK